MEVVSSARVEARFGLRPKKMFGVKVPEFSTRKFRELRAPAVEEPFLGGDSNNNTAKDAPAPEAIELTVLAPTALESASPRSVENGTTVTPEELKKILKSTKRKKEIRAVEDLVVEEEKLAAEALRTKHIKKLKTRCPSLKSLTLRNLNLSGGGREHNLQLRDFPAGLESLSLRDSAFNPKSFFDGVDGQGFEKFRVLDLSRSIFVEGRYLKSVTAWPKIESLRELYLEGALHGRSAASLEALLKSFPNLEVLDLECADLRQGDLTAIARLLPNLRELYLGQTGLRDAAIVRMVNSEHRLNRVEVICLCETNVTGIALQILVESCPWLRSLTARRSSIRSKEARALQESISGVEIKLVEKTDIHSVLRDRCCDHYSSSQNRCVDDLIEQGFSSHYGI